MAEVLGIVASAITVGQLTTQILNGIKTLHTILSHVKDAPHAIADVLKELELLGLLLTELQVNFPSDESSASLINTMQKCVQLCEEAAENIAAAVTKLEKSLGRRKILRQWTAIQAALRKGELDEFQNRLNRAKLLLSLAVNSYTLISNWKQQQLLDRVLTIVSEDGSTRKATKQLNPPLEFYSKPQNCYPITRATIFAKNWLGLGHYIQRSTSQIATDDDRREVLHRIREWHFFPSQWLPLAGFQLRIVNSWKYVLNPIRIVPIESPIFRACLEGDIPEMSRLISQGQASLYDTSPAGRTLLHIAAGKADSNMCHWLLENGADSNAINTRGETALFHVGRFVVDAEFYIFFKWMLESPQVSPDQTVRELVEFGQSDPLALSRDGYTALYHNVWFSVETLRFLVAQQQVFDVELESSELRLDLAQCISSELFVNTDCIRFLLGDGPIPRDVIQSRFNDTGYFEGTLLTFSARRLTALFQNAGDITKELAFMSDLIKGGADVHELHEPGATCLDLILTTWPWGKERNKQELISEWLKCLQVGGIDLQEYCRKEEEIHQHGKIIETKTYRPSIERFFSVVYGPGRDDLTIRVRDGNITVGYQENVIPGAWDTESEFIEKNRLVLFQGTGGLVDWTASTMGFDVGDYGTSRAYIAAV